MMKNSISIFRILPLIILLAFTSCEDYPQAVYEYQAIPETPTGTKLVNNTGLFATIFSDSTYTVTPGVEATEIAYLSMKGVPMRIFIFEVDLKNPEVTIETSTPNNKVSFGMQPMTLQATYEDTPDHRVWGGINGDFYNMTSGVPQGIVYKEGVPLKTTFQDATCTYFAITKDKKAVIAGQDEYPSLKQSIQEALGGRVWLIKDGIDVMQTSNALEPRTCIGVSKEQDKVYMMAVDGRNATYSNGMTYTELGKCMKALGAYNAINLDGGGSTTFFRRKTPDFSEDRFEIRNWPSDNGGKERPVANGLLIISQN